MTITKKARRLLVATFAAATLFCTPDLAHAEMVNCVQFVKKVSPVALHGNAYEWWDAAAGTYIRSDQPKTGAVMVFSKSRHLPYGHVAVVQKQVDQRTLLIDHANWSRFGGQKGHIERSVRVVDVSEHNDWSKVRVWYHGISRVGDTAYGLRGFVYPNTPAAPPVTPVRMHGR